MLILRDDKPKPPPKTEYSDTAVPDSESLSGAAGAWPLPENELKALDELKQLVRAALENHTLLSIPQSLKEEEEEAKEVAVVEKAEDLKSVKEAISETVTKVIDVDEDGTKTMEAIAETVVATISVSSSQDPNPTGLTSKTTAETKEESEPVSAPQEVSIWGMSLLKDERSDVILWKFLRARDFKVNDAFSMLKNTIQWRKEFKIDELVENEKESEFEFEELKQVVFMYGESKEGSPVCYNVLGEFKNKELYEKVLGDEEKRGKFLRWRVRFLERSVRGLDFGHGGVSTILQVTDLRNSPGLLGLAKKQALELLQDNYPEFVAKHVFINVPWWYIAVNKVISAFMTQRTKSKFVYAVPSRSAETLFNYIAPEKVPVHYGGLSCENGEFNPEDAASQITIKPGTTETLDFSVNEVSYTISIAAFFCCISVPCHLTWEVRVVGWEVSYGAEFVPSAEKGYTVIIQKIRKLNADESIVRSSFKVGEPGKVVITIDNATSRRKQLLYRLNAKPVSN
ncbi:Patellin-3-like protein [Drosera capensis]